MKCINCGEENREGSLFCKNCGVKLETAVQANDISEDDTILYVGPISDPVESDDTVLMSDVTSDSDPDAIEVVVGPETENDEELPSEAQESDAADGSELSDNNEIMEANFEKLQNNVGILASQIDRIFEAYKEQYAQLSAAGDNKVSKMQEETNALQDEIAALKGEIAVLKDEISSSDIANANLQSEVAQLRSDNELLAEQAKNAENDVVLMQGAQEIEDMKAEIEALKEDNAGLKAQVGELTLETENLKNELEEKNNEIERLITEGAMPKIQKKCGQCGRIFEDDSAFCPFCGVTLE